MHTIDSKEIIITDDDLQKIDNVLDELKQLENKNNMKEILEKVENLTTNFFCGLTKIG